MKEKEKKHILVEHSLPSVNTGFTGQMLDRKDKCNAGAGLVFLPVRFLCRLSGPMRRVITAPKEQSQASACMLKLPVH